MKKLIVALLLLTSTTAHAYLIPAFTMPPSGVYRILNPSMLSKKKKPIKINIHITISAIFVMGNKKAVLIGTKIYKEGDKVDGMIIKKITLDKVIFKRSNDDYEVDMNSLSPSSLTVKNGEVVQN